MTKDEKRRLKKTPANEVRKLYEQLVDDVRSGRVSTSSAVYDLGWRDGYQSGYQSGRRYTQRVPRL